MLWKVYELNISYCKEVKDISGLTHVRILKIIAIAPNFKGLSLENNRVHKLTCAVNQLHEPVRYNNKVSKVIHVGSSDDGGIPSRQRHPIGELEGYQTILFTDLLMTPLPVVQYSNLRSLTKLVLTPYFPKNSSRKILIKNLPSLIELDISCVISQPSYITNNPFDIKFSSLPNLQSFSCYYLHFLNDFEIRYQPLKKCLFYHCNLSRLSFYETINFCKINNSTIRNGIHFYKKVSELSIVKCEPTIEYHSSSDQVNRRCCVT
jgi:hypothetical protein